MKKSLKSIVLLVLIFTLLAGCASTPTTAPEDVAEETAALEIQVEGNTEPENQVEETEEKLRVVLVLSQKLGDAGPMDDMNKNVQKAAADFGIEVSVFEATEASQYEEVLRTFAREGVDLIATAMPAMVEATKKVAVEFPEVKFTIVFPLNTIELPNVSVVEFSIWEGYYLAGILAGSLTDTNILGHGIGAEQSALLANYHAFTAGARTINPDIEVLRINTNTFDDPAKGKDAGISMAGQGADIVVTDMAATALGVIEAAEELGFFVIGDSTPHYDLSPEVILADTMLQFGPALYASIESLVKGTWKAGVRNSNLAEGGVGLILSPRISEHLTPEQKERFDTAAVLIEETSKKIKSGELIVIYNPEP